MNKFFDNKLNIYNNKRYQNIKIPDITNPKLSKHTHDFIKEFNE